MSACRFYEREAAPYLGRDLDQVEGAWPVVWAVKSAFLDMDQSAIRIIRLMEAKGPQGL